MDRNTLTQNQTFYISEFQEEAAWLAFMHSEGWKMTSTNGFKYRFEACPQEDWVYQLDFRDEAMDEAEYVQMYADYGWEFVTRFRHWYYFRKIRTAGDDMSIFSDNESRIDMCRKVIRRHTLLFLFVMALFCFMLCGSRLADEQSFLDGFFGGAVVGCVISGSIGLFFVSNQIQRLRRKIRQMENPLQ